jgi:predicted P-loop ATPase
MLALDADRAEKGLVDKLVSQSKHQLIIYSTHSHTPESPRVRIIIPLTRDVTPDEFNAISRYYANDIGIDQFDECSYRPQQLMYFPSTPSNGEYIFEVIEGEWLAPDKILEQNPQWRDLSQLPTSKRESAVVERVKKRQQDPHEKTGIVGAFCRAYSIEYAIEMFLSNIYEPSLHEGRYDFIEADSSAGVVIYDSKFAYSHHASDPAYGRLLNAFDLVKVHHFTDMDDKEALKAMLEFAGNLDTVKLLLSHEKLEQAQADFDDAGVDWETKLKREKSGTLQNTLGNLRLILENDPKLQGIKYNQLADSIEISAKLPWKNPANYWRDADDAQLMCYLEAYYGNFSARNVMTAVTKVADDRSYHPIKDYLEALPSWDGVKRVDTLMVDYLGAENNTYTHAVTRKMLCAAYIRVYKPGIKFDSMLVINGIQGIGKSTLISKLGGDWYTDSLQISDMDSKNAPEKLQGYWLVEIGELAGLRKADLDKVKAFLSRQDDKYRPSYGRRVMPHPRQCVIFGTTNAESGYLRDTTGNRRFLPLLVSGICPKKPWELTSDEIKQIWAEVLVIVEAGETLHLDPNMDEYARYVQRQAIEHDEREGFVREYLETLLPDEWETMSIYQRRDFIRDPENEQTGTKKRGYVSNIEIWCECFGKAKEDMRKYDSHEIASIMERIEGWDKSGKFAMLPIYGKQRCYVRK